MRGWGVPRNFGKLFLGVSVHKAIEPKAALGRKGLGVDISTSAMSLLYREDGISDVDYAELIPMLQTLNSGNCYMQMASEIYPFQSTWHYR